MSEIPHYEIGQKLVCVKSLQGLVAGQVYQVVEQSPFSGFIRINHWANQHAGGNGFDKGLFKPFDPKADLLDAIAFARLVHPDVFGGTAK